MAESALSRRLNEFTGVACFAGALLWLIALVSYSPSDPAWFFNSVSGAAPQNFAGRVGAFVAEAGVPAPRLRGLRCPGAARRHRLALLLVPEVEAGYTKLDRRRRLLVGIGRGAPGAGVQRVRDERPSLSCRRRHRRGDRGRLCRVPQPDGRGDSPADVLALAVDPVDAVLVRPGVQRRRQARPRPARPARALPRLARRAAARARAAAGHRQARQEDRARERARDRDKVADAVEKLKVARAKAAPEPDDDEDDDAVARCGPAAKPPAIKRARPDARRRSRCRSPTRESKTPAERRKGGYVLPPVTLLDAPKDQRKIDERELMDGARLLEEKCREFSVEGTVVQIHPGPVVTTYEFKPDAGVKYSRITGLADDLCLAMQAESVLIDRIPGKSTVGIQIPNAHREPIALRELLEAETYTRSTSRLTMALGKTIHGEPFVGDLATMPHLLIAGSTGAGKSVSVNAMISSILFRSTPDDVRFIMIDPKRLELGMYEDIPHLLTPVVVDPKQAANALRWGVREMEERYKTLAAHGVRNIEQYNRNVRAAMAEPDGDARSRGAAAQDDAVRHRHHRRAGGSDDGGRQGSRRVDRAAGADGARRRHPPDSRDAAAVGGRHHRAHQGEPAGAHRVPRRLEDRLAHDSRRQRRRAAARQGRHALPAAGVVAVRPHSRPVHLRAGDGAALQLPAQAGQADLRHDDHRRREARPRSSSSRRTSSTTKPRASSSRAARRRSRTCSAACGSASAARRGWWT